MIAKVLVRFKEDVFDPAGSALTEQLNHLGFTEVKSAMIGKYIELHIETGDRVKEVERVEDMCQKLLANPLIEDFEIIDDNSESQKK